MSRVWGLGCRAYWGLELGVLDSRLRDYGLNVGLRALD